jgi:hypothetical protein
LRVHPDLLGFGVWFLRLLLACSARILTKTRTVGHLEHGALAFLGKNAEVLVSAIFDFDCLKQFLFSVYDLALLLLLTFNPLDLALYFKLVLVKHDLGSLCRTKHLSCGVEHEGFVFYVVILQEVVDPEVKALSKVLVDLIFFVLQILKSQLRLGM